MGNGARVVSQGGNCRSGRKLIRRPGLLACCPLAAAKSAAALNGGAPPTLRINCFWHPILIGWHAIGRCRRGTFAGYSPRPLQCPDSERITLAGDVVAPVWFVCMYTISIPVISTGEPLEAPAECREPLPLRWGPEVPVMWCEITPYLPFLRPRPPKLGEGASCGRCQDSTTGPYCDTFPDTGK